MTILGTHESAIARINGLCAFALLDEKELPVVAVSAAQLIPPGKIPYHFDFDGLATMVVDGPEGTRVRNLFAREAIKSGPQSAAWDLKDESGRIVPMGTYTWKAIAHPPLALKYVTTVYPNVLMNAPDRAPWLTSAGGPDGWMADHTAPRGGATAGDLVFFSSPVAESGISFHAADLTGKKLWGISGFAGFTGGWDLTADLTHAYAFSRLAGDAVDSIWKIDLAAHNFTPFAVLSASTNRARRLTGVANVGDSLYLSVNASENWLDTAATSADVNPEACIPRYPVKRAERKPFEHIPDPRGDFMGLFRLGGAVPGYGNSETIVQLQTTKGASAPAHCSRVQQRGADRLGGLPRQRRSRTQDQAGGPQAGHSVAGQSRR